MGSRRKSAPRPRWTETDEFILRQHYWRGTKALRQMLPGRSINALHVRASRIGVKIPRVDAAPGWKPGRLKIHANCPPLVKTVFRRMNEQMIELDWVGEQSGVHSGTISNWRTAYVPTLANFEAVVNALGGRLVIKWEGEGDEEQLHGSGKRGRRASTERAAPSQGGGGRGDEEGEGGGRGALRAAAEEAGEEEEGQMSEGFYRRGRSNAAPRMPAVEDIGPALRAAGGLPVANGSPIAELVEHAAKVHEARRLVPPKIADTLLSGESAKASGYTGNVCDLCGSSRMRIAGHCMVCEDCGETTGCS